MNSFFKILFLFFLVPGLSQAQTFEKSKEMQRIAYSAKEGVEIFAESTNGQWCDDIPAVKIFAQNNNIFETEQLSKLTTKLGIILEHDCPQAGQIILDGYANNSLVFQGAASKIERWKAEKGALKIKIRQLQANAVKQTTTDFDIHHWVPPADKQKIEAHIDSSALEYRIYSKTKSCSILYTTDKPAHLMDKWTIAVGNNSCSENLVYGRAEVSVFNEKGNFVETLDGYFTEGRFTGRKNLNVVLLNRYGQGKETQAISYLIDTDPELKIHYVGFLKAPYNAKAGKYAHWQGCSPFTIAAVTENESLFLDKQITENIIHAAQSYADIVCSGVTNMNFFATTVPQNIPGMDIPDSPNNEDKADLIFSAQLTRKPGKHWQIISDTQQNLAKYRELEHKNEELREHQLMMADYNELLRTDYLGRLAYLIGEERIDNLQAMTIASKITQRPIPVNLLVRIQSAGVKTAIADWPITFEIEETSGLITRTGWHLISGFLDFNKKNTISFKLNSATMCDQDACAEVSDLTSLIRRRFEKPNWKPWREEQ